VVRGAVADFVASGGGDFVTAVAAAVPFRVMANMIGMPLEDEAEVTRWTAAIMPNSDPEYCPIPTSAIDATIREAEYADSLIEDHRLSPRDDLIGMLLNATIAGRPITHEEVREFVCLYVKGGTETTRHLIAHGMQLLLEWPEQRRRVVDGSAIMADVVEEMLRWSTPVMQHSRWPTEQVELGGQQILPGERTILWLLSANHDESVFADPDAFDVNRKPTAKHATFGAGGPHFCIGAQLSRLEGQMVFKELRPYLDLMQLTRPADRLASSMFNGIKHLHVSVS
jgi:cholest-4-en-3-one 26-monooxygenase